MTNAQTNQAGASKPNAKGVLCAKCDHLNPPGCTACEYCQGELFLKCRACGQMTQEALPRCAHCGARMHKRMRRPRWWKRFAHGGNKITLPQILMLVIAVFLAYYVISRLAS